VRRRRAKSLRASEADGRRARVRGGKRRGVRGRGRGPQWRRRRGRRRRLHGASYSFPKCGFVNPETKSSAGDPRKSEVLSRSGQVGKIARESARCQSAKIIHRFLVHPEASPTAEKRTTPGSSAAREARACSAPTRSVDRARGNTETRDDGGDRGPDDDRDAKFVTGLPADVLPREARASVRRAPSRSRPRARLRRVSVSVRGARHSDGRRLSRARFRCLRCLRAP
jgi:hypothetical protein